MITFPRYGKVNNHVPNHQPNSWSMIGFCWWKLQQDNQGSLEDMILVVLSKTQEPEYMPTVNTI
jgi:hypothetical protein